MSCSCKNKGNNSISCNAFMIIILYILLAIILGGVLFY